MPPSKKETTALLFNAFESLDEHEIRRVPRSLVNMCPEAFDTACQLILVEKGKLGIRERVWEENFVKEDEDCESEDYSDFSEPDSAPVSVDDVATKHNDEATAALKRKRTETYSRFRYEVCVYCDETYDVLANDGVEDACQRHPGDLEYDNEAEIWLEWRSKDVFVCKDTPENREKYPEGFKWSCCNGQGNEMECQVDGIGRLGKRGCAGGSEGGSMWMEH